MASNRVTNLVSELRNVSANAERDAPIVVDGVEEGTEDGDELLNYRYLQVVLLSTIA